MTGAIQSEISARGKEAAPTLRPGRGNKGEVGRVFTSEQRCVLVSCDKKGQYKVDPDARGLSEVKGAVRTSQNEAANSDKTSKGPKASKEADGKKLDSVTTEKLEEAKSEEASYERSDQSLFFPKNAAESEFRPVGGDDAGSSSEGVEKVRSHTGQRKPGSDAGSATSDRSATSFPANTRIGVSARPENVIEEGPTRDRPVGSDTAWKEWQGGSAGTDRVLSTASVRRRGEAAVEGKTNREGAHGKIAAPESGKGRSISRTTAVRLSDDGRTETSRPGTQDSAKVDFKDENRISKNPHLGKERAPGSPAQEKEGQSRQPPLPETSAKVSSSGKAHRADDPVSTMGRPPDGREDWPEKAEGGRQMSRGDRTAKRARSAGNVGQAEQNARDLTFDSRSSGAGSNTASSAHPESILSSETPSSEPGPGSAIRRAARQASTRVQKEVVQHARFAQKQQRSEITVQLDPPELGKMKVVIAREEGELNVHINVENPEFRSALKGELPELERALREGHGWEGRTDVSDFDQGDASRGKPFAKHKQSSGNYGLPEENVSPRADGERTWNVFEERRKVDCLV